MICLGPDTAFANASLIAADSVARVLHVVAGSFINRVINYLTAIGLGFAGAVASVSNSGDDPLKVILITVISYRGMSRNINIIKRGWLLNIYKYSIICRPTPCFSFYLMALGYHLHRCLCLFVSVVLPLTELMPSLSVLNPFHRLRLLRCPILSGPDSEMHLHSRLHDALTLDGPSFHWTNFLQL